MLCGSPKRANQLQQKIQSSYNASHPTENTATDENTETSNNEENAEANDATIVEVENVEK